VAGFHLASIQVSPGMLPGPCFVARVVEVGISNDANTSPLAKRVPFRASIVGRQRRPEVACMKSPRVLCQIFRRVASAEYPSCRRPALTPRPILVLRPNQSKARTNSSLFHDRTMKVFAALAIVAATLTTAGHFVSENVSAASNRASTASPSSPIPIRSTQPNTVSSTTVNGTGANMRRRVVCSGNPPRCVRR
jgi:hypothetical protein